MSLVLPETPLRAPLAGRAVIAAAVPAARILSRRPPRELKTVLTRLATGSRPATYTEAKLARDQVLTASPRTRGSGACLIRSLATVILCRSRGTWPTWCVGVIAAPPFTAHAWLEVDGEMVDEPVASSHYRTFFTVPHRVPEPTGSPEPAARGEARRAGDVARTTAAPPAHGTTIERMKHP